eukprot:TRINITY_DN5311_c0_g2_i1.p1 TRINITY_DN5311_c0_g2~~TRINITY_DN5311_c0_g2_i1.p1  ORF type:complete len:262 (+),score=63.81 TRINITY_DN5311_c0_g2_i1:1-786(+)
MYIKCNLFPGTQLYNTEENPKIKYKDLEKSGRGGYGNVYFAKASKKSSKSVAIKILDHNTKKSKKSNENEITLLKKCQCQNVVTYVESFLLEDEVWIVMEHLNGGTLNEVIKLISLSEKQMAYIATEILRGIQFLHEQNVVHRDLKSHNIMLSVEGDAKIVDFGLAFDLCIGGKSLMCGSPYWMAPEIINKWPQNKPIDIWGLGITLLEMANKSPPFKESKIKALLRSSNGEIGDLVNKGVLLDKSKFSSKFINFVSKCLK